MGSGLNVNGHKSRNLTPPRQAFPLSAKILDPWTLSLVVSTSGDEAWCWKEHPVARTGAPTETEGSFSKDPQNQG